MAKSKYEIPDNFDPAEYREEIEKIGEQVAEYMDDGFVRALKKSDISVRRAFEERYTSLGYQKEFGLIDDEVYYEKLAQLRDKYFSKNSQEWYRYTAEIYQYKSDMLDAYEAKVIEHCTDLAEIAKLSKEAQEEFLSSYLENHVYSAFRTIASEAERAAKVIEKQKSAYAAKLETAFGSDEGYDTKVTKIHNYYPTGDTLYLTDYSLSTLDEEIKYMKEFDETLKKLIERADQLDSNDLGIFFDKLQTLPVADANRLATLLLQGDDEVFTQYLSSFRERKELSESVSGTLFDSQYTKLSEDVRREITEVFTEIPEMFFSFGEEIAENFTEGFQSSFTDIFSDLEWIFHSVSPNNMKSVAEHRTFAPVYNLYGSGETVTEQLISARNAALLSSLRTDGE